MANGDGVPTNTVQAPTGIITKMLDWVLHPRFSDSDPIDWLAFVVLFVMAGVLWSKVVKQTLDAKL
jgi:hypothetical protein